MPENKNREDLKTDKDTDRSGEIGSIKGSTKGKGPQYDRRNIGANFESPAMVS